MMDVMDTGIDWINTIPSTWSVKRLKAVLEDRNESNNPEKTDFILSLTNDRGVIPYTEKGEVGNKSKDDLTAYKLAYPDDIVMNSMNVFIGSVALSKYFGCVSPVYYMLHRRNEEDSIRYYNYLFQTKELQEKLHGYGNGIMEIRMRIQMSKLNTVMLPVPPTSVQHRIAEYLDRKCAKIDAIIEKQQAVIEKLNAYKLSVITEAVTKGLNPDVEMKDSGIEWIGKIPSDWKIVKLKYCTYIRARLGWKGLKADEYTEKGFPLLSAFNIVNNKLTFENLNFINQNRYDESPEIKLSIDDVLLVKDGAGIGKCAIVTELPYSSTVNGSIAVVTSIDLLSGKFLYYYFMTNMFQKLIDRIKGGMGVPHLFQSDLKEIQIPLPTENEQNRVVDYLEKKCSKIDASIIKKQSVIDKLQNYKKSLIYEVVTGKKEV
ncbi:MAG: restriction endonuclease subunit S [Eubacteriales bacterium]|nr:restriction endonuclease subunit S [Eubacteriales bacterium]